MRDTTAPTERAEMIIVAPNGTDAEWLEAVKADMVEMGAPTIRAYYDGEVFRALEGSHRIAAAHDLGLVPEIVDMDEDDEIDHDFEDVDGRTVADVLDYLTGGMPDPDTYYTF